MSRNNGLVAAAVFLSAYVLAFGHYIYYINVVVILPTLMVKRLSCLPSKQAAGVRLPFGVKSLFRLVQSFSCSRFFVAVSQLTRVATSIYQQSSVIT